MTVPRRPERGSVSPTVLLGQADGRLHAEFAAQGHDLLLLKSIAAWRDDVGQVQVQVGRLPGGPPAELGDLTRARLAGALRELADVLMPRTPMAGTIYVFGPSREQCESFTLALRRATSDRMPHVQWLRDTPAVPPGFGRHDTIVWLPASESHPDFDRVTAWIERVVARQPGHEPQQMRLAVVDDVAAIAAELGHAAGPPEVLA
jgi:hypothetical protein